MNWRRVMLPGLPSPALQSHMATPPVYKKNQSVTVFLPGSRARDGESAGSGTNENTELLFYVIPISFE